MLHAAFDMPRAQRPDAYIRALWRLSIHLVLIALRRRARFVTRLAKLAKVTLLRRQMHIAGKSVDNHLLQMSTIEGATPGGPSLVSLLESTLVQRPQFDIDYLLVSCYTDLSIVVNGMNKRTPKRFEVAMEPIPSGINEAEASKLHSILCGMMFSMK